MIPLFWPYIDAFLPRSAKSNYKYANKHRQESQASVSMRSRSLLSSFGTVRLLLLFFFFHSALFGLPLPPHVTSFRISSSHVPSNLPPFLFPPSDDIFNLVTGYLVQLPLLPQLLGFLDLPHHDRLELVRLYHRRLCFKEISNCFYPLKVRKRGSRSTSLFFWSLGFSFFLPLPPSINPPLGLCACANYSFSSIVYVSSTTSPASSACYAPQSTRPKSPKRRS